MNYLESSNGKDVFAVLKKEGQNVLGRVVAVSDTDLVLQSVSKNEVPVSSVQRLDIFSKGHIFFRDLPVKIVSNQQILDARSFSKVLTKEIRVTFDSPEADVLLAMIKRR